MEAELPLLQVPRVKVNACRGVGLILTIQIQAKSSTSAAVVEANSREHDTKMRN